MWGFSLFNPVNKRRVESGQPWSIYERPAGTEEILIVEDYVTAFSTFKTAAPTTQGTTIMVVPDIGGSIALTDILMAVKKKNAAVVTLRFTDGSNTEVLYSADVTNGELYLAHGIKGRMQGWKDAQLEFVIAGADVDTNVTVVYMRLPSSLSFTDWDTLR